LCGIAGFAGPRTYHADDVTPRLKEMSDALVHRGPDDSGLWYDNGVGFAHRRLSIIDIDGGAQPMAGDRGCVIVFNGEIYNYLELRADLESDGIVFQTKSDTEVVLKLYEKFGPDCLSRLIGMFALAIWDPAAKRLFLARDRLGKKPLYYAVRQGTLYFASELKGLLAHPEFQTGLDIDPRALSDYLSFGYVLTPKSFYRDVFRLPAAHFAFFAPETGTLETHEYWRLEEFFLAPRLPNDAATKSEFTALLDDAVRLRLRADVPIAMSLSGGIDSAAILESVARQSVGDITSYSVGFNDPSFDESVQARETANFLGIPFEKLSNSDAALEDLVWHADTPLADTSISPTHALYAAIGQRSKVALSGDGGDELLAGYETYRADALYRHYRRTPLPLQKLAARAAQRWLKPSYKKVSFDYKLRQFLAASGLSREDAHIWWRTIFSAQEKRGLLTPELTEMCEGYDPATAAAAYFAKVGGASFLDQTQFVDIKTWLQDDILVKVDRMSMASSVEVRCPFLDHRLVEFCAQLPNRAKLKGAQKKVILREVLSGRLPESVVHGRKSGFNAPTARDLGKMKRLLRTNGRFRSDFAFDPAQEDVTFKLFSLNVLHDWFERFDPSRPPGEWNPVDHG